MAMVHRSLRPDGPQQAIALDTLPAAAPLTRTEIARTSTGRVFLISDGMDVVSADGIRIGCVKEARRADMLVDRPWRRDVYVPFSAVRRMTNNQLVLTVGEADIDRMNWPQPSLI